MRNWMLGVALTTVVRPLVTGVFVKTSTLRRLTALVASVLVSSSSVADAKYLPIFAEGELPVLIPVPSFRLWQLNFTAPPSQTGQTMGYAIQTSRTGKVIVIDGGSYVEPGVSDADALSEFIEQALGDRVDMWFITHQHYDHFGALADILGDISGTFDQNAGTATCTATDTEDYSGPQIEHIYGSLANPVDLESSTHHSAIQCLDDVISSGDVPSTTNLRAGDTLYLDGVLIEVLNGWNPSGLGSGDGLINNGSLVLRVSDAFRSVLFTGDIGPEMGEVLVYNLGARLKSDFVQMPHHGGQVEDDYIGKFQSFFETVGAKYCLWPTEYWLWEGVWGGIEYAYADNVAAVAESHLCGAADSGRHYKAFETVHPGVEIPVP